MRTFEHQKIEIENLSREDTPLGRFYLTPNGNRYASITTVLAEYSKEGIEKWQNSIGEKEANLIRNKASKRGTRIHSMCESFLKNETGFMSQYDLLDRQTFLQLKNILLEKIGKIYCQEQTLYSDRLKVAGTVDLICDYDGELSIVDFKTSRKKKEKEKIENYFMQCSAYAEMFEELTGKQIKQIVVMIALDAENHPQIFVENKYKYLDELQKYIDNFYQKSKSLK